MATSRGYYRYRGRRAQRGRTALTVLLILVIVAAGVVMFLQKYVVYDENGTPHLESPWRAETAAPAEELPELDLVIQEAAPPAEEEIRAAAVPQGVLTRAGYETALAAEQVNAVMVTLKSGDGTVYFDAASAVSGAVAVGQETGEVLAEVTEGGLHAIARISCFRDPKAANQDVEGMALKNTGGYVFYDGSNSQWLDPGKTDARSYLCHLAAEAAALGFDEILLTDVSYPTEGKLEKIDYGAAAEGKPSVEEGRAWLLETFLREMRAALEPYGVALSVELPASVLASGADDAAGLVLAQIAPLVERIYAAAEPEEAAGLAEALAATGERTMFVPVLEQGGAAQTQNWVIFP